MRFSQRRGIIPVKSEIQIESMDTDLRNSLWNAIYMYYWGRINVTRLSSLDSNLLTLFSVIWKDYFKIPLDSLYSYDQCNMSLQRIKKYFFECHWYEVYDFIEFIAHNYAGERINREFMGTCNKILEQELSGYRFVGGLITQITAEEEISEIEEALKAPISQVKVHLNRALELLTDRKNPDYRNSIKESISAVEALCIQITNNETTTLGRALNKIEADGKLRLHTDLKEGFKKIYSYTSEAEGIRHSLMDEPNLSFEDAKFMLVSCSAFINYLLSKASKVSIRL